MPGEVKISHFIKGAALSVLLFTLAVLTAVAYRYPLLYRADIRREAAANGLNGGLVAAVVWTESKYRPDARSGRGAVGLMQLMPATAAWCAERLGQPYSEELLLQPDYNIKLGSYYLKYLMDKFGDETLALAAYNAGEGNVAKWIEEKRDTIPFPETDEYIKRVRNAKNIYLARL